MFHKFGALMHLNLKVFESKKGNNFFILFFNPKKKKKRKKAVRAKKVQNQKKFSQPKTQSYYNRNSSFKFNISFLIIFNLFSSFLPT